MDGSIFLVCWILRWLTKPRPFSQLHPIHTLFSTPLLVTGGLLTFSAALLWRLLRLTHQKVGLVPQRGWSMASTEGLDDTQGLVHTCGQACGSPRFDEHGNLPGVCFVAKSLMMCHGVLGQIHCVSQRPLNFQNPLCFMWVWCRGNFRRFLSSSKRLALNLFKEAERGCVCLHCWCWPTPKQCQPLIARHFLLLFEQGRQLCPASCWGCRVSNKTLALCSAKILHFLWPLLAVSQSASQFVFSREVFWGAAHGPTAGRTKNNKFFCNVPKFYYFFFQCQFLQHKVPKFFEKRSEGQFSLFLGFHLNFEASLNLFSFFFQWKAGAEFLYTWQKIFWEVVGYRTWSKLKIIFQNQICQNIFCRILCTLYFGNRCFNFTNLSFEGVGVAYILVSPSLMRADIFCTTRANKISTLFGFEFFKTILALIGDAWERSRFFFML